MAHCCSTIVLRPPPQGAARPKGAPLSHSTFRPPWPQSWDERLRQWLGGASSVRNAQRVEEALSVPEGMFEPCLSVLDGYPVRYGVSVASSRGRRSTNQ